MPTYTPPTATTATTGAPATYTPPPKKARSGIKVNDGPVLVNDGESNIDFGATPLGQSFDKTFVIENVGDATLSVSDLKLPGGFSGSLGESGELSIRPGGGASLTITLDADEAGSPSGTIRFETDTADGIFDFTVLATVLAPVVGQSPSPLGQLLQDLEAGNLGSVIK